MSMTSKDYYSDEKSKIIRLRGQMLIHSYIYYHLNTNIITDDEWQRLADELVLLQSIHGTEWGYYDEAFRDWTGATGCHLPRDRNIQTIATNILNTYTVKRNNDAINEHRRSRT